MQRLKSASGNHVAAGYDPLEQVLRVEFRGGAKRDYHGVTPEVAKTAFEAPSFGQYLNKVIIPAAPTSIPKEGE
jgi:hypothetical protein